MLVHPLPCCCCLQAPRRAAVVQANEEVYWQRMSWGIGADMPALAADAAPRLWSYRHCAEVDGRFFYSGEWLVQHGAAQAASCEVLSPRTTHSMCAPAAGRSLQLAPANALRMTGTPYTSTHLDLCRPSLTASGVPYEMRSREYVAHTINLGLNHSSASEPRAALASPISRAANVSRADVVAIAAMEGVGLAEAVLKYNLLASTARAVPFTNVRAMSNWLHQPLKQVRGWAEGGGCRRVQCHAAQQEAVCRDSVILGVV